MVTLKSFLSLFLAATFLSCQDELIKGISPCLDEKISEFIDDQNAEKIVRIDRPGDTLYWFVSLTVDAGEVMWNIQCEAVCITDLEGISTTPWCDETHTNFPKTVIWEK